MVGYQLPMTIMSNILFKACSYEKHVESVCLNQVLTNDSQLLDATNIYSIFCTTERERLNLFKPMTSLSQVLQKQHDAKILYSKRMLQKSNQAQYEIHLRHENSIKAQRRWSYLVPRR